MAGTEAIGKCHHDVPSHCLFVCIGGLSLCQG